MRDIAEENKIDLIAMLSDLLQTLKKFWLFMLGTIIVLAIAFSIYAWVTYQPEYQSQASFSVNTSDSAVISSNIATEQVRESLPYILQSDVMKNMVMDDLGLTYFPAVLALESQETANLFTIKVTASDAQTSYAVLESVLANCPQASVYVLGKIHLDVLDNSGVPAATSNVRSMAKNFVIGGILGIIVCLEFAFFYVITNHTIRNTEDFKKYLSVSCVATVPFITFKKRRKKIDKHIHIYNDKVGHAFIETFRAVRTRVVREMNDFGGGSILVTSSIPGEGKSTVAANLALSLAETGKSVVLVDLDLRHPSIAKVLGMEAEKGKSVVDILEKGAQLPDVVRHIEEWNLSLILGGEAKSDPTKLLNAGGLNNLIEELENYYEYIVLDTPPAAMLSDASVIARYTDSALYVVKQDCARIERIAEGLDALAMSKISIVGAVLNGFEMTLGSYGNYQYGRYGRYGHYGAYGDYSKTHEDSPEYVEVEMPQDMKK